MSEFERRVQQFNAEHDAWMRQFANEQAAREAEEGARNARFEQLSADLVGLINRLNIEPLPLYLAYQRNPRKILGPQIGRAWAISQIYWVDLDSPSGGTYSSYSMTTDKQIFQTYLNTDKTKIVTFDDTPQPVWRSLEILEEEDTTMCVNSMLQFNNDYLQTFDVRRQRISQIDL